jgi:hypothetical protein
MDASRARPAGRRFPLPKMFRVWLETPASLAPGMFKNHPLQLGVAAFASILALTACGGSSPTSAGSGTATAPEANNGEAQSVSYVDSRYHYRIDAPGHITVASDGTAGFVGPTERIQIEVKQASTTDLPGLARADLTSMPATFAGFQLKSGPTMIDINGKPAEKFVFTYSGGVNSVTNKPLTLVGVRYYIPKDSSTLAVVTYGIASDQYDPQGADDIASTFRWQ